MQEIEITKALITFFNIGILIMLPFYGIWHAVRISKFQHWSDEWWTQIIIVLSYLAAFGCEVPALWSRVEAYYVYKMEVPASIYTLTTWDRYGHAIFYTFFYLLTWIFTKKRIPNFVKQTLS